MRNFIYVKSVLCILLFLGSTLCEGCGNDDRSCWDGTWQAAGGMNAVVVELKQDNGMFYMHIPGTEKGEFLYDAASNTFYTVIGDDTCRVTFNGCNQLRFASPRKYIDFNRE